MKLNNKGFAVSIILYSMIAIITIVLLLIISVYSTNIRNKLTQADIIKKKISNLDTLTNRILGDNEIIKTISPNLTKSSITSADKSGLYKSIVTNTGESTYYFRGNIDNNYVKFGKVKVGSSTQDLIWRIVRINEDKSVRLILDDSINTLRYEFYNYDSNLIKGMYYTNTKDQTPAYQVKYALDKWYKNDFVADKGKIQKGEYFCEQNKTYVANNEDPLDDEYVNLAKPIEYNKYIPNFRCLKDGNGYGIIEDVIGLLTYDEAVFAGAYYDEANNNFYLKKDFDWWTSNPENKGSIWIVKENGSINSIDISDKAHIRPVINLRSNVIVSGGDGSSSSPYRIS